MIYGCISSQAAKRSNFTLKLNDGSKEEIKPKAFTSTLNRTRKMKSI
jgi:hypothetical protein